MRSRGNRFCRERTAGAEAAPTPAWRSRGVDTRVQGRKCEEQSALADVDGPRLTKTDEPRGGGRPLVDKPRGACGPFAAAAEGCERCTEGASVGASSRRRGPSAWQRAQAMPRRRTHAPTATGGRVGKDAPDEQAPEAHHQVVRRLASVGDRARAVSDDQEGKQRSHTPRAKAWNSAAARAAHAVGATHTGPSAKESTRRSEACATARGRTPSHALARTPVKRGRRRLSRRSCGGCRWPRPNKGRVDRSVRMAHAMEARGTGRTGRQRRCGRLPGRKNIFSAMDSESADYRKTLGFFAHNSDEIILMAHSLTTLDHFDHFDHIDHS